MKVVRVVIAAVVMSSAISGQAASPDQLETNKSVVRRYLAKVNAGDVNGAVQEWAEDEVRDFGALTQGRKAVHGALRAMLERFPDWYADVLDLIAEGDRVVALCRVSGTDFTQGRRVESAYQVRVFRLRNGKLVDQYAVPDGNALLR